ncbi:MAG: hypothetical protein BGO55_13980 [Sphingobacteriales bacterium 50-39]|nr:DUF4249 family protein [Sphingobacteriales bacterium]OJW57403.1 MAG: hypothetical protein BGO55_13980 [Sphingobacteriales bacterium 50-39]
MNPIVPYHKNNYLLLAGILCWAFLTGTACRKDPYQGQALNNELVVLAEITAGDSLKIPVSKSIQVGNGGIISFEEVNSASVKIARQDGRTWTLKLNTSPNFAGNPASIYTGPQRPHYNTTYTLQVQDPLSGTVTSQTTIPPPVRVTRIDTGMELYHGSPMLRLRFTLLDSPGATHYFVFEAMKELMKTTHYFYWKEVRYSYETTEGKNLYDQVKSNPGVKLFCDTSSSNSFLRLNVFTDDPNVDNAQVSSLDSPFRRIFLPGRIFNGAYTSSVLIDSKYFISDDPSSRGRVRLRLKSVSPELYNYLFWYEKYKSDIGSVPPGQLYSPPGNIQNGLGIFGGSSRHEWIYYFDTLH